MASFILFSCEDTLINPDSDDIVVTEDENISGEITEDKVFVAGQTYIIDGMIRVRNASITLEPGTRIEFINGGGFEFAYWEDEWATLTALGTIDDPIIFTSGQNSPAAGDWAGIAFYKGAVNCELDYCIIEYAGSGRTSMSIE